MSIMPGYKLRPLAPLTRAAKQNAAKEVQRKEARARGICYVCCKRPAIPTECKRKGASPLGGRCAECTKRQQVRDALVAAGKTKSVGRWQGPLLLVRDGRVGDFSRRDDTCPRFDACELDWIARHRGAAIQARCPTTCPVWRMT